jgi:predicted nuclease with TOPRIM domain
MTRETLDQKMQTLKGELEKADEELTKLRPRVQYLETIIQRLDGALTVLQTMLDEDTKQTVIATPVNSTAPVPVDV